MPAIKIIIGDKEIAPVAGMGEALHCVADVNTLEPVFSVATIKSLSLLPEGRIGYVMDNGEEWSRADKLLFSSSEDAIAHWMDVMRELVVKKSKDFTEIE